jgi:hypothetical protein
MDDIEKRWLIEVGKSLSELYEAVTQNARSLIDLSTGLRGVLETMVQLDPRFRPAYNSFLEAESRKIQTPDEASDRLQRLQKLIGELKKGSGERIQ